MAKLKCWYCKEELEKEDTEVFKYNNVNRRFHKSKLCKSKFIKGKQALVEEQAIKKAEYVEWDKLYQYVRTEILQYEKGQQLSSHARGRLLSLRHGDFIRKGVTISKSGYPYHIILTTFKLKKQNIINGIANKSFANDNKKFDYIMAIVSNSINDVYNMHMNKVKQEQKMKAQTIDLNFNSDIKYIKKSSVSNNSMMDNLW